MKITEISISYEETCSLPNYSNVRPGLSLAAQIELEDNPEKVRCDLMAQARLFVRGVIDQALIDNGRSPKYYSGQRYKIMVSHQRKFILIVPQQRNDAPKDFYHSSSSDYDLQEIMLDQAEQYADILCNLRDDGYEWKAIMDGDYSILPLPTQDARDEKNEVD
ncbi:MAG: hypothetical protein C4575_13045 [Desulforudis sp.]|jgi:hypothetical protein|nr:MAG: hypothetical protein C4575_13045 [Desulforudis sp.]